MLEKAGADDIVREMIGFVAQLLMEVDVDNRCERSETRNGYRECGWDTRAGTVQNAYVQGFSTRRSLGRSLGSKIEQQPSIAVSADRLRARVTLSEQSIGEECMEGGGQGAHVRFPHRSSKRSAASRATRGQPTDTSSWQVSRLARIDRQ